MARGCVSKDTSTSLQLQSYILFGHMTSLGTSKYGDSSETRSHRNCANWRTFMMNQKMRIWILGCVTAYHLICEYFELLVWIHSTLFEQHCKDLIQHWFCVSWRYQNAEISGSHVNYSRGYTRTLKVLVTSPNCLKYFPNSLSSIYEFVLIDHPCAA